MLKRQEVVSAWRKCKEEGFGRMPEGLFLQTVGDMKKEWWWNDEEEKKLNETCLSLSGGLYAAEDDDVFLLTDTGIDPIYISNLALLFEELKGMVEEDDEE